MSCSHRVVALEVPTFSAQAQLAVLQQRQIPVSPSGCLWQITAPQQDLHSLCPVQDSMQLASHLP